MPDTPFLAEFEMPAALVAPALAACRRFNTVFDGLFYDVAALTAALRARGEAVTVSGPANAPLPADVIDLAATTDPEGSLLAVDPTTPPYITPWRDVAAYIEAQRTVAEPIRIASLTGVGSSALGSAALAWNVALGLGRPVVAIVPGYGVADAVLQGLGGWFGFGLYDALGVKSHLQDFLALAAPRAAAVGRRLSASAPGARTLNDAPVFRTGCGSSDVLHALMQALPIAVVVGHSKGALSIGNALRALPPGRLDGVGVVTLGCPLAEDLPGVAWRQVLGRFDALGALNAWGHAPDVWVDSGHSTNTALPLSMDVEALCAVRAYSRTPPPPNPPGAILEAWGLEDVSGPAARPFPTLAAARPVPPHKGEGG